MFTLAGRRVLLMERPVLSTVTVAKFTPRLPVLVEMLPLSLSVRPPPFTVVVPV